MARDRTDQHVSCQSRDSAQGRNLPGVEKDASQ